MTVFYRIASIFSVALKRLFSQRGLALATTLGLVVAVALTMSVPLYADAVYNRVLQKQLAQKEGQSTGRPPFAFMFSYVGDWVEPLPWQDTRAIDDYLSHSAARVLGLPLKVLVRYFETDTWKLFAPEAVGYNAVDKPLEWVKLAFATDFEKHVTLQEGRFPKANAAGEGTLEVLMSEPLARKLGAQVGEDYVTFARRTTKTGDKNFQFTARITGVWKPIDPKEEYWFYGPSNLENQLMVTEEVFVGQIDSTVDDAVNLATWYLVLDGSRLYSSDAVPFLGRINFAQQQANNLLPQTKLLLSPAEGLEQYREITEQLTFMLYVFSVPILGLLLSFIGLVVGLSVGRRRNEIAVLRSRGATAWQVLGMAVLEALLLGALALIAGTPLGALTAYVIGKTRSFLNFSAPIDLRVSIVPDAVRFGLIAVGVTALAQILPTINAAQHTIVTYKQERARTLRPPWWQRAWLDVMLLIPAAYGAYVLRRQGSIAVPLTGVQLNNDPFQNPLLMLVPALGIFALTLLIVRVLPVLMATLAWLAARTKSVGFLMAARYLARTPSFYTAPMVLLVLTLSLSAFTASLAETLDRHLYDKTYYQNGADVNSQDMGRSTESADENPMGGAIVTLKPKDEAEGPAWLFLPISDYLNLPGVQSVARVGRVNAIMRFGAGDKKGVFIGIDRTDFPRVSYWRRDLAPEALGALMNRLAPTPSGILMQRSVMSQQNLRMGDPLRVEAYCYGENVPLELKIVGALDYFPTWYPDQGPLVVGNLDYLFEQAGGLFPYTVWLKTAPGADFARMEEEAGKQGQNMASLSAAPLKAAEEQQRPERQGMFGVLSVGFAAAALLTVLGFLLYALFSFRSRFIEMGVLRAIGLSAGQLAQFLAWELAFLILTGVVAGTGLGVWVSHLFIPYLQVGDQITARIPPYIVEISWRLILRIYVLFGLLFFVALGVLAAMLLRINIFQAVKLGETV